MIGHCDMSGDWWSVLEPVAAAFFMMGALWAVVFLHLAAVAIGLYREWKASRPVRGDR